MVQKEARRVGLLWSRRKGAEKRAGVDLTQSPEEEDDAAVQAGQQMRARVQQMVAQIPDFPDRYNPEDQHPATPPQDYQANAENGTTRSKYRRIAREDNSDNEAENQQPILIPLPQHQITQNFLKGRARLDSTIDLEAPPRTVLQSSPSTSSASQPSQISLTDQFPAPRLGLIRLGPGRRRPRRVKRIVRNPFIDDEAEESADGDDDAGIAAASTSSIPSNSPFHFAPDHDSESEADDCFIVGDDCFE